MDGKKVTASTQLYFTDNDVKSLIKTAARKKTILATLAIREFDEKYHISQMNKQDLMFFLDNYVRVKDVFVEKTNALSLRAHASTLEETDTHIYTDIQTQTLVHEYNEMSKNTIENKKENDEINLNATAKESMKNAIAMFGKR